MFTGKVFIITGANGRIGSALTDDLIKNGAKVIIADQNITYNKIRHSRQHLFFQSDLTKKKNIEKLIFKGRQKFGSIDGLIHCLYPKTKDWGTVAGSLNEKSLKENLFNQLGVAILTSQLIINYFLKEKIQGKLVLISSIQGLAAPKFNHYKGLKMYSPVEYTAIKSGIISVVKYFAKCYKKKGIAVNSVSPGGILDSQSKKFIKNYLNECGTKGLLNPNDIVGPISYLLSDYSKYINGQNLIIDDGWSL
jgi:NAD(P)-dependent dehydrogenase (short-subunit alcohol dehydrogenase family)